MKVEKILLTIVLGMLAGSCGVGDLENEAPATSTVVIDTPIPSTTPIPSNTPVPIGDIQQKSQGFVRQPIHLVDMLAGEKIAGGGPWLMLHDFEYIYLVDAEGQAGGYIIDQEVQAFVPVESSPVGGLLAFGVNVYQVSGLRVLSVKDSEIILELDLLGYQGGMPNFENQGGQDQFLMDRSVAVGAVGWSSDGTQLAFVSSHLGPTPDIYLWDVPSNQITQLTSGSTHAVFPIWSPGNRYIFHAGVEQLYVDHSGGGYSGWQFYAARPNGAGIITLANGLSNRGDEEFLGWASDTEAVMRSGYWHCGYFNLRTLNIETGKEKIIWADQFEAAAYAPGKDFALVWVWSESNEDLESCGEIPEEGLYLVSLRDGSRELITNFGKDYHLNISWSEAGGHFLVESRQQQTGIYNWYALDLDGEIMELEGQPYYSPQGNQVAFLSPSENTLSMIDSSGEKHDIDLGFHISEVVWSPDGEQLFFTSNTEDKTPYDLFMVSPPDYIPVLLIEDAFGRYGPPPAWVLP